MCTIDVVGLYPAVEKALERRDDKSISSESLLELTELVLKNNIFEDNGEFFKQKQGTAIGTKMAPPYAILFMDGGTLMTSFLFGNTGKIAFSSSLITLTTAILQLSLPRLFQEIQSIFWMLRLFVMGKNW